MECQTSIPPIAVSPPSQEREAYKKLGLTTQSLAAHTQKEEQAFLSRFRELRGVHAFKADCSHYLERQKGQMASDGKVPIPQMNRHSWEWGSSRNMLLFFTMICIKEMSL